MISRILKIKVQLMSCYPVGWSVDIFFIGQSKSTNQRSGMILEVKIQIFGMHEPVHARQSFRFQKISGGPNINIFW